MQWALSLLQAFNYFLRLHPALENKYISIDVFNTDPVGKRKSGVGPNPVHHRPQLCQEGNQTKTGEEDRKKKLVQSIFYGVKSGQPLL